MISIHTERRIVAILDRGDREFTVDEIIQRLRGRGHFPAPTGTLDGVRREIGVVIQGYFNKQEVDDLFDQLDALAQFIATAEGEMEIGDES